MLWLGLDFPDLPLEVARAGEDHDTAALPRVVTDNGRVLLRNEAAVRAGIARGCTLATAHSIVPGLVHYPRQPDAERARLELLGEALYGFSARVSLAPAAVEDPGSTSGIALEIGGSLRLFGDGRALGERVRTLCHDLGHRVRMRQATTALAALILARADVAALDAVALGHAAVEAQRLSVERIERLANMGIHTLRQLLALPRKGLAQRFGADLVDYLARITGEHPDPRPLIRPAEQFRAALHLLEPLRDKEALAFPLKRLLADLEHWLVARQLGAEQLRWQFAANARAERVCMPVRFARAQQQRTAFLDITRLALAETALPEDVIDVYLEAHRLVPWSTGSRDLFGLLEAPAGELADTDTLVDQLRARLGHGACHGLATADQHTPERAWDRVAPLARRRSDPPALPARRPLWLFDPPRGVARAELALLRGPERIHTGWWDAPGQARDYYVARHRNGAECWVFVDPADRWFLHGYFA